MNFKAFLTGSRAYGKPVSSSDVDLVVFVNEAELAVLKEQADAVLQIDECYEAEFGTTSLRFGNLNLLCCLTEEAYVIWRKGTWKLKDRQPVVRQDAMDLFHRLRVKAGMTKLDEPPKVGPRKGLPPPFPKLLGHLEEDIPF